MRSCALEHRCQNNPISEKLCAKRARVHRYAADVVDLDQVFDGGADMLNAAAPRALALWSVKV